MKTMFSASNSFTAESFRPMGQVLGCVQCEAMKKQKEAEEEFRRRYGVVNAGQVSQRQPVRGAGVAYG
jgi:hypothetical protein